MFAQFDYGKTMLKQVEAHRRLAASQQQKRLPALLKAYEQYALKLTSLVQQPSSSNPGQMKNAAEALVDVSAMLGEPAPAYRTFAEMASRSRKVPVVPGLAAMVDKLLEQPTDLKKERATLLSWRVVTGTMRPERYLKYLAERARLTDDIDDWKDLAWGASQLVKKGTVAAGDEIVYHALNELYANRKKLGEQSLPVKLSLAESLFARKNFRQAEIVLTEAAVETKDPPQSLRELVEVLLDARPETCWELHQLIISRALADYEAGAVGWTMALEKLNRARLHQDSLVRWLLDQPLMPREQRLSVFTAKCIRSLDLEESKILEAKWATVLSNAGAVAPEIDVSEIDMPPMPRPSGLIESEQQIELPEAIEHEPEQPEELVQETEGRIEATEELNEAEALAAAEIAAAEAIDEAADWSEGTAFEEAPQLTVVSEAAEAEVQEVEAELGTQQPLLAADTTDEFESEGAAQQQDETVSETAQLLSEAEEVVALDANLKADEAAPESVESEAAASSEQEAAAMQQPLQETESLAAHCLAALEAGEFGRAFELAAAAGNDDAARIQAFTQMEEWLQVQAEPSAQMMMTLAQVQREQTQDPAAGFEAATTAMLLEPDNAELAQVYSGWTAALSPGRVHTQRARQAASLAVVGQRMELLDTSLEETEELLACAPEEAASTPMEWLDQLRPLLEQVEASRRSAVRYRWTRLYLSLMSRSERKAQLPAALMSASSELAPEQALELVHMLESDLPAEARFTVECQSLLRQGSWEEAIELVQARSEDTLTGAPVSESLDLVFNHLPAEAVVPASRRILGIFADQRDQHSQLDFVRYMNHRFGGSDSIAALDALLDEALARLCEDHFEPAVRYRVEQRPSTGDPLQSAADLLQLVEQGDEAAARELEGIFGQLLEYREHALLGQRCALALAQLQSAKDKAKAAQTLIRAGLKLGQYDWAQEQLAGLNPPMDDAGVVEGLGRLAIARQDFNLAAEAGQRLSELSADAAAYELLEQVLAAKPESANAHLAMLRVLLGRDLGDPAAALDHAFALTQLEQSEQNNIHERLAALLPMGQQLLSARPQDLPAQLLLLSLYAACGKMEEAAALTQDIVKRGEQASSQMLAVFDRLALQDADLPSSMILAWGQALFNAGQVGAALVRLAGLRENVGDYPEYISLLEEIKSAGGGAGVNMQLAEAYLRVSLWQRAAGEYAAALEADPELAEPVLTQLRHHSALDPNPNKYPLHLVGLRAVAHSTRDADWGWALSALTWLIQRWSAEELYEVTQKLWQQAQRGEMAAPDRAALLLYLHKLAVKTGDLESGLDYLVQAWALLEHPSQELLTALAEFDASSLGADSQQLAKLRRLELEAAIAFDDAQQVADSAQLLAATGEVGREVALESLRRYQQQTEDKLPVLLGRLKLLKVDTEAGRDEFVTELLAAADAQLPAEQVRHLIHTVLELIKEDPQSAAPQRLLLQLFRQLGDLSRAWQLALWSAGGKEEPAPTALEVARQVAQDEFAFKQQIALAEILLVQGDTAGAMTQLEKLDPGSLGELAMQAATIGEVLLNTAQRESARRWLVSWYRESGHPELAADHVLWAYAEGQQPPAGWIHEDRSAELLWRSGCIYELSGNPEAAVKQYRRGREAKAADPLAAASICLRLSEIEEQNANLDEALVLCREALGFVPDQRRLQERCTALQRAIHLRQIGEARQREDSPARTLEIARLLRLCDDLGEALSELQSGISRGQQDPDIYVELAECFMEEADFNLARRAYSEALSKLGEGNLAVEQRLRALYGLATVEERTGNLAEAIRQLEQLLVIRHNYLDSRQRLEQLSTAASARRPEPAPDATGDLLDEILSLLGEAEDGKE